MTDFSGKRALVTGGGSGVGAAVALALAEAGARVTIVGRRFEPLNEIASRHGSVDAATADVTDEGSLRPVFDAAGPFDIVVANAGAAESAPATRTDTDLWQRMLAVNLTGVFLTFREALRRMEGAEWGRLVAVGSTAGLKGYAYVAAYCAAKHGVVGLTRALALETARTGITVNAICPGYLDTPLTDHAVANIVERTGRTEAEARAALAKANPQGRLIRPEEVAATVLWLCGPGSESVTGQAIAISGGEV